MSHCFFRGLHISDNRTLLYHAAVILEVRSEGKNNEGKYTYTAKECRCG